ncbi:hypothetical protein SK128_019633, partial [Halocaridina rubra]
IYDNTEIIIMKAWILLAVCTCMTNLATSDLVFHRTQSLEINLGQLGHYTHAAHSHKSILDPEGIFTVYWTPDLVIQ